MADSNFPKAALGLVQQVTNAAEGHQLALDICTGEREQTRRRLIREPFRRNQESQAVPGRDSSGRVGSARKEDAWHSWRPLLKMEKQLYAGWEIRQWSGTQTRDGVERENARLKARESFYAHGNATFVYHHPRGPVTLDCLSGKAACEKLDIRLILAITPTSSKERAPVMRRWATQNVLALAWALLSSNLLHSAPRDDEAEVKKCFESFQAALKAKDASKIWKLLDAESRDAAERAAKAVKMAYNKASAEKKASWEKALGLPVLSWPS